MKILIVTTVSNTVNAFLIPHIKMLVEGGYQVDIATNVIQDLDESVSNLGCKIYNIPFQRSPFTKGNYSALKKLGALIQNKYDKIHTHTPIASFITRLVFRKERKKGTEIIYTAHGFHFYKESSISSWLFFYPIEKYLSKITDVLITINEEDYQLASKKFYSKEIIYIPGVGIDRKCFKPIKEDQKLKIRKLIGLKHDHLVFTAVGELNTNKNHIYLLRTFKELSQYYKNISLVIVGEGVLEEQFKEYVRKYNLNEQVKLLGYRKDVELILKASDYLITSSKREGLPINVLEGMACGLPVVASNCRGNRDLITNYKNGFLFSLKGENQLYPILENIINNGEKYIYMKGENRSNSEKYSIENVLFKLEKIYWREDYVETIVRT